MSDIDSTTWLAKRKHSDDGGAAVGKHALASCRWADQRRSMQCRSLRVNAAGAADGGALLHGGITNGTLVHGRRKDEEAMWRMKDEGCRMKVGLFCFSLSHDLVASHFIF